MKKVYSFILMLVLVVSLTATAFAASGKTYKLGDLGMSIEIPSDYVVFTRDTPDDDPNLAAYKLSKKDLSDVMKANNIYLNAWDKDVTSEIVVTMVDSSFQDFNLLSDSMLTKMVSSIESQYADNGVSIEKYEIYQADQAKFLKLYIQQTDDGDAIPGLQYCTVYDNKSINITLHSYSGKISAADETALKSIADTAHFDKDPQKNDTAKSSEAFIYQDPKSGAAFTVPANWSQTDLPDNSEFLDVAFSSTKNPEFSISYGSKDLWSEMSASDKKGLSRSDVNNTMYTAEKLSEMLKLDGIDVSTVKYADKEYYEYVTTTSTSTFGLNLDASMTCLVRFENGYVYTFHFVGDGESKCFKDFELVLNSVTYPSSMSLMVSDLFTDNHSVLSVVICALIAVLAYTLPILIYRFAIKKQPIEKASAVKLMLVYGIGALAVMAVLFFVVHIAKDICVAAAAAIVLLSIVNYMLLTCGANNKSDNAAA